MSTLQLATKDTAQLHTFSRRLTALVNACMLTRLTLSALWRLLFYDALYLIGFAKAYQFVRRCQRADRPVPPGTVERVVWAVEEACVWYPARTYCLQRSAICTWLLRRRGVAAEMVIGFRPIPIDSHAWVEVAGQVVNDRPQYQTFFRVLDRI